MIADDSMVLLRAGLSASATDEEKALTSSALVYSEGKIKRFLGYDPEQRVRTEYYPQRTSSGFAQQAVWEATADSAYLRRTSGASTSELQVRHLPVRKTDSSGSNAIDLRIDYDGRFGSLAGSFAADTQKTEGSDFWPSYDGVDSSGIAVCHDGIIRSVGLWPEEPGAVKITYVAGYTYQELSGHDSNVDASPIQDAVIEEATRRLKQALVLKKSGTLGWLPGLLAGERLGDYSYRTDQVLARRLYSGMYELLPETKDRLSTFVNYARSL